MASAGKPPKAPDPGTLIALQNQYNRSNQSGPFGSSTWSAGGPGGHETQTTTLSPEMQGAMDRAFQASAQHGTPQYIPQGANQLTSAIMGKVGSHYGLTPGQGFDTNMKNPYSAPPSPGGMGMGQAGMPNMGGFNSPGGQDQLAAGMQPGQPGQLGHSMGINSGSMGGMPPGLLAAMGQMPGGAPQMPQMGFNQPGTMPVQQQTI